MVQALHQRGIDFIVRCDSARGCSVVREMLRRGDTECWACLPATQADKVSTWELDGAVQMHIRLLRHVSSSGRIRVLATSLDQRMASMSELADLHHGRWRIEEAFKRLKHRLGLESVSGLSQHALLVDVATKVLADNLAALLNRSVTLPEPADAGGVRHKVNRAQAARTLSRCIGRLLLIAGAAVQIARDWGQTLGRSPIRHVSGQSRPRKQSKHKPHPSQAYKRAA